MRENISYTAEQTVWVYNFNNGRVWHYFYCLSLYHPFVVLGNGLGTHSTLLYQSNDPPNFPAGNTTPAKVARRWWRCNNDFFSDGAYHPLAICQRPAASFVQKVSERRTESLTAAGQASCRRPDPEPQMRQSKHQHRRRHRPEYFFFALLSNLFAKSASDDRSFPNSIMVKLEILLPNVFNLALHKVF